MPIIQRKINIPKRERVTGRARSMQPVKAAGTTAKYDQLVEADQFITYTGTEYDNGKAPAKKADYVGESQQIADPFQGSYELTSSPIVPIKPIYDFLLLAQLVQQSNILRQCIESYVINIESYGHTLEYVGPEGKEKGTEQQAEKQRLEAFLSAPNPDTNMRELRERARWDKETIGNMAFEIVRDGGGRIVQMLHTPAVSIRKTRRDNHSTPVTVSVPNPADPTQMVTRKMYRHFCRYVQFSQSTLKRIFFKEFGDPRRINCHNGEVVPDGVVLDPLDEATEMLYLSLYTPGHIYGLPRWIGLIPCILGSRESEIVNLNFFKENAIPAMVVLVSGGALTQESFDVIDNYINAIKGQKAMQRVMVLEAAADDTSGSVDHAPSAPKIDIKPMISERQQEGLFQDYDQKNQQKIRSCFRLPPIYAGRAEDYTRASAFASMLTAEAQIFAPERSTFDDIMNNMILRTYAPKYWRFKSLGAPTTDPESLSRMLTTFEQSGAMTPNVVIKLAQKMLGVDIKPVTEPWGDYPFSAVMEYIAGGREIHGLDEFLVSIEDATGTNPLDLKEPPAPVIAGTPGAKAKPKGPAAKKTALQELRTVVKSELASMVEEIRESVTASLQVPTSK